MILRKKLKNNSSSMKESSLSSARATSNSSKHKPPRSSGLNDDLSTARNANESLLQQVASCRGGHQEGTQQEPRVPRNAATAAS